MTHKTLYHPAMLSPRRTRRHPIIRNSFALKASQWKLYQIVGLYLIATVASGFVAGLAFHLSRTDGGSGLQSMRDGFGAILDPGDVLKTEEKLPYTLIGIVASFTGIILPVFLLGAFVFKLFYQDPIVWRNSLSIEDRFQASPILHFRFYNGTALPLAYVTIQAFARIRSIGTPSHVDNVPLKVIQGSDRNPKESGYWAFSRSGIPFTVSIPLTDGLTAKQIAEGGYIFMAGEAAAIKNDRVTVLVLITGIALGTGLSFYSAHEYELSESLQLGHYQEIEVLNGKKPQIWRGWENFELTCETYVFGYASLSSPSSVEASLGHTVDPTAFCYAKLQGWSRSWCVGSDATSHPERTYFLPNGLKYDGLCVVLGIEPHKYSECDGAVFPVARSDLNLLDIRERNYERINISQHVTWAGKPDNCTVYTYVPLSEARARIVEALKTGREINIRRGYIKLVQQAFAELGKASLREEWTNPPYNVEDLRVQVDPILAFPKAASGNPSYLQNQTVTGDVLQMMTRLHEKGLLTLEEFERAKSRIPSDEETP